MSILWRLHLHYLMHRKTQIFFMVFIVFNIGVFIAFSRFFDPVFDRVVYQDLYVLDFFMETFGFIKLSSLVVVMYLVIQLFILSPSDIVLLQRVHHRVLIFSKMIIIVFVSCVFTGIVVLYYGVIGWATHGMLSHLFTPILFIDLTVFIVFYSFLLSCVALAFNHMFAVFSVLLGYFASEMLIDFDVSLEQISGVGYFINVLFMNIHVMNAETIGLVYPYRIILYTLFVYGYMIVMLHQKRTF